MSHSSTKWKTRKGTLRTEWGSLCKFVVYKTRSDVKERLGQPTFQSSSRMQSTQSSNQKKPPRPEIEDKHTETQTAHFYEMPSQFRWNNSCT